MMSRTIRRKNCVNPGGYSDWKFHSDSVESLTRVRGIGVPVFTSRRRFPLSNKLKTWNNEELRRGLRDLDNYDAQILPKEIYVIYDWVSR